MSDTLSQAAADILDSELGRDATYRAGGTGSPVPCRCLLRRNLEITDTYGTVIEVETAITIPRDPYSLPQNGDTVEVGGITYRVGRVIRFDDYLVTMSCSQ